MAGSGERQQLQFSPAVCAGFTPPLLRRACGLLLCTRFIPPDPMIQLCQRLHCLLHTVREPIPIVISIMNPIPIRVAVAPMQRRVHGGSQPRACIG